MPQMGVTSGWVAPGFEGVREVFDRNFAEGREIGSAFSAYHRGAKVVDLWGGIADPQTERPWEEDTIALVFSTTKGATAICANKLAQEGALDVDAPVAKYWPEFARNEKADIPVSYLLSHRAGLAWVDREMSVDEALTWERVIEALEHQFPSWEPGTQAGYHATTYGWLVGEVVRRITGRSIGTYFRDEIAEPLGLDFWIGLPEAQEPRVARLVGLLVDGFGSGGGKGGESDPELAEIKKLFLEILGPDTPLGKSLYAPGGALATPGIFNTRALRAAEVPAAGGVGDARSLARMYAACIDEVDGVRLLSPEQVERATTRLTEGPNTILLNLDIQFGLGFMLHAGIIGMGGPKSFGHFGMGGSAGWADPEAELAIGYVMNRLDIGATGDARSWDLVNACYRSLG